MRIEPFKYLRPATVQEACRVMAEHRGAARILAGGTDLMPRMKQELATPAYVLDMADAKGFHYLRNGASGLSIGAGTTLHDIAASELIRRQVPSLAQAAHKVASQQIRNIATIGGNLCLETRCWFFNQSRAWKRAKPNCFKAGGQICYVVNKPDRCFAAFQGDTAPALLTLDARIRIVSARHERTIPLTELYSGKGQTPLTLAADEIIAEIQIPALPADNKVSYQKFSHRKAVDFPLAGVAVRLDAGSNGRVAAARVAISGVGSAPVRVPDAEKALAGSDCSPEAVAAAAGAAAKAAQPVNNLHHGRPALRRRMVDILLKQALEEIAGNAPVWRAGK